MSVSQTEFEELLQGVRAGSQESARRLHDLYGYHVLRVVRRKLHRRLRSQYDSADLQQAVWASFFAISVDRRVFQGPDELVDFLCGIAANKAVQLFRQRMQTRRRNINRELPLAEVDPIHEADVRQRTPSQLALAGEDWQRLLQEQSPVVREMLGLLREGYSYREIGARVGLHPKAIQRHLRRLVRREGR
jgi:RNA polymerase sigma factor (sigma-70 family)